MVTDKIFSALDEKTQTHIEICKGQTWFKPIELGRECDTFYIFKRKNFYKQPVNDSYNSQITSEQYNGMYKDGKYVPPPMRNQTFKGNGSYPRVKECYICKSNSYLARQCQNTNRGKIPK